MSATGTDCDYVRARTVEEALDHLQVSEGQAKIIAGGVALVSLMNQKLFVPTALVDITRIERLHGIRREPNRVLRLGALVTHGEIERSPVVRQACPLLTEMAKEIACGRIRNRGTLGGNLCHADPQEDPPAALLALGAIVRIVGPGGVRTVAISDFFVDSFQTAVQENELLEEIVVPTPQQGTGFAYIKFGPRRAMDYSSTIGVAVLLRLGAARGGVAEVGIGLSGVGPTPIRAEAPARILMGQKPDREVCERMSAALQEQIDPLDDFQFSADYKRHVAGVLMRRTVERAYARAVTAGQEAS